MASHSSSEINNGRKSLLCNIKDSTSNWNIRARSSNTVADKQKQQNNRPIYWDLYVFFKGPKTLRIGRD